MDPMIQQMGKTKEEVIDMMRSCTFTDTLIFGPVGSLSGGWRMRLALSRAMLKEPELLLLDEPTNHVDVHGVAWLTKYINDLSDKKISSMIVSHDTVFLDNVAQDCCHYEKNRKLKVYKGNLSEFVKLVPEAAAYYKLESENVAFSFPDPGMLEGLARRRHRRQRRGQVDNDQDAHRRDHPQRGRGHGPDRAPPEHAPRVRGAARLPPH